MRRSGDRQCRTHSPRATSAATINPDGTETYTFTLGKPGGTNPAYAGTVAFYDGGTLITGCEAVAVDAATYKATCGPIAYPTYGVHYITAVFSGDSFYNPSPCNVKQPSGNACPKIGGSDPVTVTITAPGGSTTGVVNINNVAGTIKLAGPASGQYSGLLIFQDRASANTVTISPAAGLSACGSTFMTDGVPGTANSSNPVPAPCGALGGMKGTIYSADQDSFVIVDASGLADVQIISGKIQVNSGTDARFAYTPGFFANGSIHLVE